MNNILLELSRSRCLGTSQVRACSSITLMTISIHLRPDFSRFAQGKGEEENFLSFELNSKTELILYRTTDSD